MSKKKVAKCKIAIINISNLYALNEQHTQQNEVIKTQEQLNAARWIKLCNIVEELSTRLETSKLSEFIKPWQENMQSVMREIITI